MKEYIYEDDFSNRVLGGYKVGEFKVSDYQYGRCHLFALVAQEYLSLPINALVIPYENEKREISGFALSHVYLRVTESIILDASGLWNFSLMKNAYDEPDMYEVTDSKLLIKELKTMINKDLLLPFENTEKLNLYSYVEKMKENNILAYLRKENEPLVPLDLIVKNKPVRKKLDI